MSATGGTTGLGKLLLKDVPLLSDAYGNEYYTALEDSLDTEADTSHLVNGSIFGGDSLVVDELAGADLSAGWVEDTSDAITKFSLSDANSNLRAELVEPDSSSEYPNTYNVTTYAADGITVLETYAITNTESLSITGSQGSVIAQLGLVEQEQPIIDTIEVTTDSGSTSGAQIEGDVIITTVNFSEAVFVSGTPTIQLTFGDQTVTATYAGHANHIFAVDAAGNSVEIEAPYSGNISYSQAQAFTYTIKQGDETANATFVSVDITTLDLNGGSILDAAGNMPEPSTITKTTTIFVDAVAPEVKNIVMNTGGESDPTLTKGDTVTVAVEFTKAVTITGSASIKLAIGPDASVNPTVVEATYAGHSSDPSIIQYFTYNIGDVQKDGLEIGLEDSDGISVVDGSLRGDGILDTSGNLANVAHDSTHVASGLPITVDSLAPTILSVVNPVAAQFALINDDIAVTMNFSEPVTLEMGQTATISLLIDKPDGTQATVLVSAGSSESTASISGSQLVFTSNEPLPIGLVDTNGIQIKADSLTFTSDGLVDLAGNSVVSTFEEMSAVNQQVDTVAPTITITSDKPTLNSLQQAEITFNLSENSTDFTSDDIEVTGGQLSSLTGSGDTYKATFTPMPGISENATFKVISGRFTDAAGNDNTNSELQITVDTIVPTVSIAMADSVLAIGESTEVTFTFSEQVFGVNGSSISDHITAENGTLSNFGLANTYLATEDTDSFSNPEASAYDYGDGDSAINFANTQIYTNGISEYQRQDKYEFVHQGGAISFDIASEDLDVNGGGQDSTTDFHLTLTDQFGMRIKKNDDGRSSDENERYKSDGSTNIHDSLLEVSSLPAGTYTLNVEDLIHSYNDPDYNEYSSTTDAPYQLTILTEADKNVTDVMLAELSNGSIKDAYGNHANLSNLSVINNSEMKVDAVASKVTGVEITSNEIEFNVLSVGDIINTIVHFDEDVFVTGTPTIKLALNNGTEFPSMVEATYSGNGGLSIFPDNVLTFSYVVAAGDIDTSGISVVENSLANSLALGDAEAGTILDAAGNAALLDHSKVDSNPSMLVDTIAPELNVSDSKPTVSFNSETNTIEVTVTFSEKVTLKDGETATLTVLVNNDTDDVPTPVVVTATGTGTNSQSLVFKSIALPGGLFATNTVQLHQEYALNSLFDQAGNLVKDFYEIDVALDVPIDTRANREIKQEEAFTRFSELLEENAGEDDAPNLILDVSDAATIAGVDTITGGQGFDQIFGGNTDEHLIGGEGSDFLKGGGGNDLLDGGTGDDYVYADAGDDTVKGGEGNDTILFNKLTVDGNQLVLDLFKDVTAQATNSELGTNTISGIENAVGTNKGDVIDGNGYDNIINGADGDDLINGGRGNDQLFGAADDDVLRGGRGNDTLEGGKGADQLYGGSGRDTFVFNLNDDLLNSDADLVFDFSHYADKIRILGMEENQSVEMLNGTLSIKTEVTDSEASTSLDLATGFDTRLEHSHLVLEFTQPEIV